VNEARKDLPRLAWAQNLAVTKKKQVSAERDGLLKAKFAAKLITFLARS
jgi:hypothetical protein